MKEFHAMYPSHFTKCHVVERMIYPGKLFLLSSDSNVSGGTTEGYTTGFEAPYDTISYDDKNIRGCLRTYEVQINVSTHESKSAA